MLRALLLASLLGLVAAAMPAHAAADPGLVECRSQAWDAQGDGSAEAWRSCSTPPCGCDCPFVGAGLVVEAAGQQRGAVVATSGCQTAYGTTAGPADGGQPVTAWPIAGGGILRDP